MEHDKSIALGMPVLVGNLLFALIALFSLTRELGTGTTVIVSALYFLLSTLILLLTLTGAARDIAIHYIDHRTRRYHLNAIYSDTIYKVQDMPQITVSDSPDDPSFVAVVDHSTQRLAIEWVRGLYLPTGEPDPHKIHMETSSESPGRLRVKSPVGPVREFLLTRRVLRLVDHGVALDLENFPNLRLVANALAPL